MSDEEDDTEEAYGLLKLNKNINAEPDADGDDEGDETNEDGVLFYVNKGGFPIDSFTWDRMWSHVNKLHPNGQNIANEIRKNKSLPEVPIPKAPLDFPLNFTIDEKLEAIQSYMNELQYNHTGTQFFEIRKNRPISGLMESAKEMMREALPIKCLEAVILSIHLTNGMTSIDRFPISFKTVFMGNVFRHVVLGVYSTGRYGALGMSRRTELMYKPLEYRSLSELIMDYIQAYRKYFHDVKKAKVGLPVPHDCHSYEGICWKHLSVTPKKNKRDEMCREIDRHAREMRQQRTRMENIRTVYTMGSDKSICRPPISNRFAWQSRSLDAFHISPKLRNSLTLEASPKKNKDNGNSKQKKPKKSKTKTDDKEASMGKISIKSELTQTTTTQTTNNTGEKDPVSDGKYQLRI